MSCLSEISHFLQYGTKALDKITKAILGHIENKVPPPKGYPGGEAMFFRGMFELWLTAYTDQLHQHIVCCD